MATPSLPFKSIDSQFVQRTGSVYDAMVRRFTEKKSVKTGRITRMGFKIPFTKEEFRQWMENQLGGRGGVRKCAYCSTFVSAADCVIDHMTPPMRGGSVNFDNLAVCCEPCNAIKGGCTAAGYVAFRTFALLNLDPDDCKDLFKRLQSQMKLLRWQQTERVRKFKKSSPPLEDEQF